MNDHSKILVTHNLSKTYRSKEGEIEAVHDLNLAINQGEIFGLLGPNGAGKTTTVKMIMGFMNATHGDILLHGRKLAMTDSRSAIGFLPERFQPNPNFTVGEYISFHLNISGATAEKKGCTQSLKSLLNQVELSEFANRKISDLSKGMGQRVGLAQALAGNPDFLLLDEPTSGLDPIGRSAVIDLLLEKQQEGSTIFFCSHILSEVERLCSRIGVLIRGRLCYLGETADFLAKWQADSLDEAFKREVQCDQS